MKQLCFIFLLAAMGWPSATGADARISLHGRSLKVLPSTTRAEGADYTLEWTTSASLQSSALNGELAPLPPGAAGTHGSFYKLSGAKLSEPVFGSFFLKVPVAEDANTNGVADFYEVDLALKAAATEGTFADFERAGKVLTTWSRPSGSSSGTCIVALEGYNLIFTNIYEVFDYDGAMRYRNVKEEPNIVATIELKRKGAPAQALTGIVTLKKEAQERRLLPGSLNNESAAALTYQESAPLNRQGRMFLSDLVFKDGNAATSEPDYLAWQLKILDPNDADGNGIPDLADDGSPPPPPALSLASANGALRLSISGEIGKVHQIESIPVLGGARWTLESEVTLTSDPHLVELPIPLTRSGTTFWRVKVP